MTAGAVRSSIRRRVRRQPESASSRTGQSETACMRYTATAMTDLNDPVLERALLAVGRTRALGLHFYGNFVGIGGGPAPLGTSGLSIDGEPPGVGAPGVSAVALATVADLAIGSAIRSHLEIGARMATPTPPLPHPLPPPG